MLMAWLIAGTLDISSAFILFGVRTGKNPLLILNYVASAVLGKEAAAAGGMEVQALGLLLHYIIAFLFTATLFLLYPRVYRVFPNKYLIAAIYGLFAWCVMNLIVVPLSRIPFRGYSWSNAIENMIILMVAIGLPVSLIAYRFYYPGGSKTERL